MLFDLYLIVSLIICLALAIFIITFGIPIFTGAPFAVSSRYKIKKMMPLLKEAAASLPSAALAKDGQNLSAVDLGSGDGRIVIALAENGFIASGLEINPCLVWYSRWKIKFKKLSDRAVIKRVNYWQEDFSKYDVVVLFGVFYIMDKLEKKLLSELKPGAIVVCNHFFFPTWPPVKQEGDIYLYRQDN